MLYIHKLLMINFIPHVGFHPIRMGKVLVHHMFAPSMFGNESKIYHPLRTHPFQFQPHSFSGKKEG